jgi:glycosyltransferase involved in cell wall biosynthesis
VRVVLVGTAYPMRGGIAHYIALLSKSLTDRGHDVFVLSFKRQYPSFLFPGKTQKDDGGELIPVRAEPILDSINPATWVRAFFWLKSVRPRLVLFKYWMPFFAPCYATVAFLAKTFLRVPVVFLCDNISPHEKKFGDAFLSKLALRFPDSFIVQSKAVLDDLLDFRPGARVRLVPHPVYDIFPPPVAKAEARRRLGISESRVILFFGYIRRYKGLGVLIEAMPEILRRVPLRLIVCGEFYEGRDETIGLIRGLGLEERVTLEDRFIPNEAVADFFCAADAVVLPYLSATQSGIAQVAYHYDRPVIATSAGGLPEAVVRGKTGFIVPPGDAKALANAVIRFYAEKKEGVFARNVRVEKRKYSWENMARAIEGMKSGNEDRRSGLGDRGRQGDHGTL